LIVGGELVGVALQPADIVSVIKMRDAAGRYIRFEFISRHMQFSAICAFAGKVDLHRKAQNVRSRPKADVQAMSVTGQWAEP
jgi:hypothetical protein